jgi:DNA-binding NarL/FixJ family response regulator
VLTLSLSLQFLLTFCDKCGERNKLRKKREFREIGVKFTAEDLDVPDAISSPSIRNRPLRPATGNHAHCPRSTVIAAAMIDEHSLTREAITVSLQELCQFVQIMSFATCDECLGSATKFDVILYHAHGLANRYNNDERLGWVKKLTAVAPVIMLSRVDSVNTIRAAFTWGVRGYIPTVSTTLNLAIEIIYLVTCGGEYVPLSGLSPGRVELEKPANPTAKQQFTPRQMAVIERLKLGKPNKIIAYELEVSESSVKAHIRNIMQKMNATNRTEVASRAHDLR